MAALQHDVRYVVLKINPDMHVAVYNQACLFAMRGDLAAAMDRLERGVAIGYSDREVLRIDPDLDALREHAEYGPRLQTLIDRMGGA